MNEGQGQFFAYMMDRAIDGKQEELKELLLGSFEQQKKTPLDRASFEELRSQVLALVKPEFMEEIKTNMNHFASENVE